MQPRMPSGLAFVHLMEGYTGCLPGPVMDGGSFPPPPKAEAEGLVAFTRTRRAANAIAVTATFLHRLEEGFGARALVGITCPV